MILLAAVAGIVIAWRATRRRRVLRLVLEVSHGTSSGRSAVPDAARLQRLGQEVGEFLRADEVGPGGLAKYAMRVFGVTTAVDSSIAQDLGP